MSKVKSYSDLEAVQRDIKRLEREVASDISKYQKDRKKLELVGSEVKSKDRHFLDRSKFKRLFKYMSELQSKEKLLTNVIASLQKDFSSNQAQKLAKRAETLKAKINDEYHTVFKQTSDISHSISPENFKKLVSRCYKHAANKLQDKYSDSKCEIQFYPEENSVCYVGYIGFKDLADNSNFINNSFYIVISQKYKENERARTFIGQANGKRTPEKINNSEIVAHRANEYVDELLSENCLV